jgi:hypothetical protein
MLNSLIQEVVDHLEALPPHLQEQVLSIVRSLDASQQRGVPGSKLLQFAGTISDSDLIAMNEAIERGCEQVDPNEW